MSFVDSSLAALLLEVALRASAVVLLALAATRLMARATAAARHLVWTVALAGVLALPLLALFGPAWRVVPLPEPFRRAAVAAPASPSPETAAPTSGVALAPSVSTDAADLSPSQSTAVEPRPAPVDWRPWLLALWAAGGALLLARLLFGVARVWWMGRRAAEVTDEGWVSLADTLARRLRLGRIVTLLRGEHASVPMTWGLLRPVVLLPPGSGEWSPERRTVVLAHELAHVRRWDALTQWVAHLAVAVYWFNPLVWMAARRLREERERACDDAVLAIGTRPVAYADHLLEMVRSLGAAEGPVAALAMARRSQFEGRMLAILDGAAARGGTSGRLRLATAALAALCILPVAALRAAPPATGSREMDGDRAFSVGSHEIDNEVRTHGGEPVRDRSVKAGAGDDAATPLAGAPAGVPDGGVTASALLPQDTGRYPRAPLDEVVAALGSDGSKAQLLVEMAGRRQEDGRYLDILRAATHIGSAGERARVLETVVTRAVLDRAESLALLRAVETMNSDGSKAFVMRPAAHRLDLRDPTVRRAFFRVLGPFGSDTERRLVLMEVLSGGRTDAAALQAVAVSAGGMSSDTEKRLVLVELATKQPLAQEVRDAYLATVRGMQSDGERALALTALLGEGGSAGPAATPERPAAREAATRRDETVSVSVWNGSHETTHDDEALTPGFPTVLAEKRYTRIVARAVLVGSTVADVRGFQKGGSLHVEERRNGTTRLVRGRPGADGEAEYSYTENGQARPFDAAARAWMARLIRESTETRSR